MLGRAEGPVYLHVAGADITIRSARPLWGKGALATTEALQAAHPDARVLAIGPAGEAVVPLRLRDHRVIVLEAHRDGNAVIRDAGVRHRAAGDQPPR